MTYGKPWAIFENGVYGWLELARMPSPDQGHNFVQPALLESAEQVEEFIHDLREAAKRVWPGSVQDGQTTEP